MVIIRSLLLWGQPHPEGLIRQRQGMHSSRPLSAALFPRVPRVALPVQLSCLRQRKQRQSMRQCPLHQCGPDLLLCRPQHQRENLMLRCQHPHLGLLSPQQQTSLHSTSRVLPAGQWLWLKTGGLMSQHR